MNQSLLLLESIFSFIEQYRLITPDETIILGLSGGPDSIFLLHALSIYQQRIPFRLVAAHLNHEWRNDADRDVDLCKKTCDKLNVSLFFETMSNLKLSSKYNGSQEEYARKARRFFFEKIARSFDAPTRIALAHHMQDQQETFFIRLLRGSSLAGLSGMRPQHGLYIRPLLQVNKDHILHYLQERNIAYIQDSTNASDKFLRNRIRKDVIPALVAADLRFDKNFLATITRLQKTEEYLEKTTEKIFDDISSFHDQSRYIAIDQLLALDPVIQYRVFILWLCSERVPFTPTHSLFQEIVRFLENKKSTTHAMGKDWLVYKQKNSCIIQRFCNKNSSILPI